MLVGDRERDRAGTGADVEHARGLEPGEQHEGPLDEDLGLRTRDQRPRVDRERKAAKPPFPEHVLERLAPRPPSDELPRGVQLAAGERAVEVHVQLDPLQARGPGEQPLRVEPRRVRSLRGQMLGREPEDAGDRDDVGCGPDATAALAHTPAASSEIRLSSAWIASVNSSRSPSRIWSRRCTVSLIR
jgi:hypothetical protein